MTKYVRENRNKEKKNLVIEKKKKRNNKYLNLIITVFSFSCK